MNVTAGNRSHVNKVFTSMPYTYFFLWALSILKAQKRRIHQYPKPTGKCFRQRQLGRQMVQTSDRCLARTSTNACRQSMQISTGNIGAQAMGL
jgi:hypothetical protein